VGGTGLPRGWAADLPGRPMVLGRMALEHRGRIAPGQVHVIGGWRTGEDGRKVHTGTALWGPDGSVVAVARATWLTVDPATIGA
jgi:acyl-CoA thioesterase FadM